MTADERIEKLLNRFGQTIEDLPKPENKKYLYGWYTMQHLDKAAREWGKKDAYFDWAVVADYACHLCDIIDRMEIALKTAARWAECSTCEVENTKECGGGIECNYRIYDGLLSDVSEEDTKRYIDDAD